MGALTPNPRTAMIFGDAIKLRVRSAARPAAAVLARADVSVAMGQAVPLAQAKSDFVVLGGQLLAVPMLMVIKAVCDHIEDLKPIGELLGD